MNKFRVIEKGVIDYKVDSFNLAQKVAIQLMHMNSTGWIEQKQFDGTWKKLKSFSRQTGVIDA